jgi:hypothetical protein
MVNTVIMTVKGSCIFRTKRRKAPDRLFASFFNTDRIEWLDRATDQQDDPSASLYPPSSLLLSSSSSSRLPVFLPVRGRQ